MIVVRVELHSARDGSTRELARLHVANIGGTEQLGDYDVAVLRGCSTAQLDRLQVQRRGRVERHPRLKLHVWHLIARALAAAGYGDRLP